MKQADKNQIKYFENLDSIRFIAALMVFLQHGMSNSYKYLHIEGTFWEELLHVISNGGTGVSIFFVLSGFLITYLLISEFEITSKVNLKKFYLRRILRIWPLYYAVVFFAFVFYPLLLTLFKIQLSLDTNILYHVLFLSNFDALSIIKHGGNGAMVQGITWSVSIEEQFYLFWPLIFTFFPNKYWTILIIFVITCSIVFRLYNNTDDILLYYHTFSVLIDLGIGGLIACLIKKYTIFSSFFKHTSTRHHLFFFLFSFSLLLFQHTLFEFKYGIALGRILISGSFALVIASQALTETNSILNLKKLRFLNRWGKYTYGIYLLHPISILFVAFLAKASGLPKDTLWVTLSMGIISFVFTLIMSKLSYKYFESRFLKIKAKLSVTNSVN